MLKHVEKHTLRNKVEHIEKPGCFFSVLKASKAHWSTQHLMFLTSFSTVVAVNSRITLKSMFFYHRTSSAATKVSGLT